MMHQLIKKHRKVIPVTYKQFQTILKKMIKLIGENPDEFSTHSIRSVGVLVGFLQLKSQPN